MKRWFQQRLQVSSNNLLRNAIRDCRYTQRPRSAICFGDVYPAHRWRQVTARRQPIPELKEIPSKPSLKLLNRLPISSSRTLVGFHTFESFPDVPLWNVKRLCPNQAAPPITGWPPARAEHHSPFGPAPLQCLHPYYELFCPCAPHRYSEPGGDHPRGSLPSHQSDRFPRSV